MKIQFNAYSDAESDLVCASAILDMACEVTHREGHTYISDGIYGANKLIQSALRSLRCGIIRSEIMDEESD